jgi:PRTRC genetic system ThiF family protein
MPYSIENEPIKTVVLVGCGGTGSILASGLCRILRGIDVKLIFIDMDRVEKPNLYRQDFFQGDLEHFKSQALAERLSRQYGREIGYSVMPYEQDTLNESMGSGMTMRADHLLIIGCVDSSDARRSISDSLAHSFSSWYIDSGNGFNSGQVLIGNTNKKEELRECFNEEAHTVSKLPSPSLQVPALLIPPTKPVRPLDCAEAVEDNEQSPTINQAMATLVLDMVWKLLTGKLTHMGAYLDMEAGSLKYVPANPVTISRMFSIKVGELMMNHCALGARYHI